MPPSGPLPPSRRSLSPKPQELAVDAQSVRIAQESAKAAAKAQDAVEIEQAKALKPSVVGEAFAWLGSGRGKATITLVGVLLTGSGLSQKWEGFLAFLHIASTAEVTTLRSELAACQEPKREAVESAAKAVHAAEKLELRWEYSKILPRVENLESGQAAIEKRIPAVSAPPITVTPR